jgi:23S rRNA (guanine745-N1)-methyltransferase
LLLEREGRTYRCARGHSYDVARSGYVNLLQPYDRRSLASGDTRDAILARARLLARGVGQSLVTHVVDRATRLSTADAVVVDLGSGSGDALAALSERVPSVGIGIDLSTAAAEHAARRFPHLTWVVANADRRLPLLDQSVDLILSLHGRRNPPECSRILTRQGRLLIAVPAPDDLIEVRAVIQGEGIARDRVEALAAEHEPYFAIDERFQLRERHHLDTDALRDLLQGTYRGKRFSAAQKLASIGSLDVTLAWDVLILSRTPN